MKYIFAQKESGTVFLTITMNQEWFSHPFLTKTFRIPILKGDWLSFQDGYEEWCCPIDQFERIADVVEQVIKKDPKFGKKVIAKSKQEGEKGYVLAYEILEKLHKKSNLAELVVIFENFFEQLYRLGSLGLAPVLSDLEHNRLTNKLEKIILEKMGDQPKRSMGEYFSGLTKHTNKNRTYDSKKELLRLSQNQSQKEVEKYLKKYCWIDYGQIGPEYDQKKVFALMKQLKKISERRKLQDQLDYSKIEKLQIQMTSELRLNLKERGGFEIARDFSAVKQYRAELMFLAYYVINLAFKNIQQSYGYSRKYLQMLSKSEFFSLLKTGKIPSEKILDARRKFCINITEDIGRIKILTGKQARNFLKKNRPKLDEQLSVDTLKGNIASPGKVQGIVKIVNIPSEMSKIKKGDILVAIQTIPELLPAMNLASAFVTEQGGITSHAAIVAREMKKPCIIGTKIATKVFKDGDLVEVDANKGIIRKVK